MGYYRQRNFGQFDEAKQLIAGRAMDISVEGEDELVHLKAGDKLPMDMDAGIRRRLWMVEHAHYEEDYTPTPELQIAREDEERPWLGEADGVTVEEGENGWYVLKAAWLAEEGEKVHGAEAAEARAKELREAGDTKGVEMAHTGGGTYTITAPFLEEPIKVKGKEAAEAKVKELRDAAPPPAPPSGEGAGEGGPAGE